MKAIAREKQVVCACFLPLFETSPVAGEGPARYYAWPDALVYLKRKEFICRFSNFHLYINENSYLIGNSIVNVVPIPTSLVTCIEPPCNSTISFATAKPIPFPPVARVRDLSTR